MTVVPPAGANLRGAVDLSSLVNRPPAAAAGVSTGTAPDGAVAGVVPVPNLVLEGTDTNFAELLELSKIVPVIVDLWATWSEPATQLTPVIENLIREYNGRFVLATVDIDTNPQLAQAFQATSVPTLAAVINGQPVQLFDGVLPVVQIREVFERVLELAAQHGVTGVAEAAESPAGPSAEPVEPELPPHHREAYEAIERGDYAAAIDIYKLALARDPRDTMAAAGLAQVSLLARLQGKTIAEVRSAAADDPANLEAQLLVADLDLSGGHIEDAFDRLLGLFPGQDAAGKNVIRQRMLELFEVVGTDDPRVPPARKRLTALLY
ncbi:putative thioredoxin [Cryobacterium sp. MP_3.1]|uniref:Co-chaperone YbbN n=1 Tax=Cryobacterium zongtaii TaxID=1259217 RepID=A0A2S3Z8P1_9MICO|nr:MULTISPECIES: tetratricopeptide repeat protein [Cryobacterium]MEC5184364.1 putative thioredoxin [Cryobacterium sp. MP_3.1]POH61925.1 co-chaperone YbbN [Cryobacterium zongtaii]